MTSRVAGLIGWPVEHSLSPAIHNAAFRASGLDWIYVAFPTPPGRLAEAIAGLPALGVEGANVTMPHKEEASRLVERRTREATRLRAVNTLVVEDGELLGENTDAEGFRRFLEREAEVDPAGRAAVLLGAGGAARACAAALADAGLSRLVVWARREARRAAMAGCLRGTGVELEIVARPPGADVVAEADLVVNATPVGLEGESLGLGGFHEGQTVVDLVTADSTPLVAEARSAGARAHGGVGMLVHQAALSFERWTGVPAPLEAMREAASGGSSGS